MSRVCVKNLPRYVTEDRLRDHFSAKGEVTDAKIIRTSDGRPRQFGFVGFRTEEEAQLAVKYFNRSYYDTSRLSCEIAQPIGDPNLPRPWSRHSQGSSAYQKSHSASQDMPDLTAKDGTGKKEKLGESKGVRKEADDPQLLEFLQVMQRRSRTKLWANDTSLEPVGLDQKQKNHYGKVLMKEKKKNNKGARIEKESVDGVLRRIPVGKGKSEQKLTRLHVHFEDDSDDEVDDEEINDDAPISDAAIDFQEIVENATSLEINKDDSFARDESVSDMEYLKKRMTRQWSDDDEEESGDDAKLSAKGSSVELSSAGIVEQRDPPEESLTDEDVLTEELIDNDTLKSSLEPDDSELIVAEDSESVAETGRLFVRNLPYTASEDDLAKLFSAYGEVSQVHLVLDKETKRSKGFAYILFMLPEAALRAMEGLDKSIFQGRLLHILPAKRPPHTAKEVINEGVGKATFKEEREAQRKTNEASGHTKAWNSFFMRQDTIAENVAQQYGLPKSDFLDPEAEDLAVRLALGETHILAETKRALSKEGVNVDVLEDLATGKLKQVARSGNVILVKNLPYTTSEADLVKMFAAYGSLGRIVLPPTKTLAVMEFLEVAEARKAFKGLAYKRFKHVPLYLEWAPDNLLGEKRLAEELVQTNARTQQVSKGQHNRVLVEQQLITPLVDEDELDPAQARSVFIKNLNFKTTEASIKKHFEKHVQRGSVRKVTIKSKLSKGGKQLSMGFGFVEFDSMETAKDVCQRLQGTVVDDHSLLLQLSHGVKEKDKRLSTAKAVTKAQKNESSTKIIVRNVAFEATAKDLRQLFLPFGQIKSLRLPKKFDGTHRGFAFLEFSTKQEAQNAVEALMSTHLYGRHLILEWAREGESLEELRARTASQFNDEKDETSSGPSKRRKQMAAIDDREVPFHHSD
ncbi:hypothetical protein O6H91_06G137600 [Diphasiastrum complanatum]|uniref:Uncharacterized protein n=3 Tax=Diphasiastrum complanatum TaxID=34168 RepID=A0ACC2DK45_DIPCM|nr:hypothetical protein O6H91_06G137600 [Diphasiastrum complanatum]KAJ7554373.1 hypothetical protein O6H91_06G137600 [Diphasiastrum complanatum]KAJ7554374.1 hypothetical protein O6H91_06G137600 [Diphasiastrum complanatum]